MCYWKKMYFLLQYIFQKYERLGWKVMEGSVKKKNVLPIENKFIQDIFNNHF